MASYAYIGKGQIYIQERGSTNPMQLIGNCSKLALTTAEDKKELMDYENGGGGVADSISRLKSADLSFSAHQISPANLALALRGSTTAYTGGTVYYETHENVPGSGLLPLNRFPNTSVTPTVLPLTTAQVSALTQLTTAQAAVLATNQIAALAAVTSSIPALTTSAISALTTASMTALPAITAWTLSSAGLNIVSGGGITAGENISITYTGLADDLVQALISSGLEYRLLFIGLNESQSNRKVVVDVHRVKFSPLKNLDLIGDDYADIQIEGNILKDSDKTGTGISQYFTVRMAQ